MARTLTPKTRVSSGMVAPVATGLDPTNGHRVRIEGAAEMALIVENTAQADKVVTVKGAGPWPDRPYTVPAESSRVIGVSDLAEVAQTTAQLPGPNEVWVDVASGATGSLTVLAYRPSWALVSPEALS